LSISTRTKTHSLKQLTILGTDPRSSLSSLLPYFFLLTYQSFASPIENEPYLSFSFYRRHFRPLIFSATSSPFLTSTLSTAIIFPSNYLSISHLRIQLSHFFTQFPSAISLIISSPHHPILLPSTIQQPLIFLPTISLALSSASTIWLFLISAPSTTSLFLPFTYLNVEERTNNIKIFSTTVNHGL